MENNTIANQRKCCFLTFILVVVLIGALLLVKNLILPNLFAPSPYFAPFHTRYSPEEHVQRLDARTKEIFANDIANGKIIDYKIDVVYSFSDDKPRFFIIELIHEKGFRLTQPSDDVGEHLGFSSNYSYTIGLIDDTTYRIKGFTQCQSPYSSTNNFDKKKYYSKDYYAYHDGENMIQICTFSCPISHSESQTRFWADVIIDICPTCYGQIIPSDKLDDIKYYSVVDFKAEY